MENDEYIVFLKSVLIKIENTVNLLKQKPSKHIPAYHKMLGVQQKLSGLSKSYKNKMFSELIAVRSSINYLMNGRYDEAYGQIIKLKKNIVKICLEIEKKNEKDTD